MALRHRRALRFDREAGNLPKVLPLIRAGQLRALAVTTAQLSPELPDTPTIAKSGLPVTAEPPDAFRARIAREIPMYKEIVDKAGLKIQ